MEEKLPIAPRLREMEVGEKASYPLERMSAVRKTACELSLLLERNYTATQDRKTRTITVTRTL